jgi:hypothetical protein
MNAFKFSGVYDCLQLCCCQAALRYLWVLTMAVAAVVQEVEGLSSPLCQSSRLPCRFLCHKTETTSSSRSADSYTVLVTLNENTN